MAKGDFALPVGHVQCGQNVNWNTWNFNLFISLPYRQPVDLPDSINFSAGLDLWIQVDQSQDTRAQIYTMFDGEISHITDISRGIDSYVLNVSIDTQNQINRIDGLLEPPPAKIIYEDIFGFDDALKNRISIWYEGTATRPENEWHPLMNQQFKGKTIKATLDEADDQATVIQDILNAFNTEDHKLHIRAGDCIGYANYLRTPIPANCPFQDASHINIQVEDYGENKLNPEFYIWRLLRNAQNLNGAVHVQFISQAEFRPDGSIIHPLLNAIGINLNNVKYPRVTTQAIMPAQQNPINVLLFPIGKLSDWHGQTWGQAQSSIEWCLNKNNLDFEARIRQGINVPQNINYNPQPNNVSYDNLVRQIWNGWGNDIDTICSIIQIPEEIIVATIAKESANRRLYAALEILTPQDINHLQGAGIPQPIIDQYFNNTPAYGVNTPDPALPPGDPNSWAARANDPINNYPGNGHVNLALSWAQLLDIINNAPGRMSGSLMQTTPFTARRMWNWLARWYPNVPISQDVANTFGVVAIPNNYSDIFCWLLTNGRNSILCGTAYHKYLYALSGTKIDIPTTGAAYNAGNIRDRQQIPDNMQNPNINLLNPWRMYYSGLEYPRELTRYYNAIQDALSTNTNGTVRFWRSL